MGLRACAIFGCLVLWQCNQAAVQSEDTRVDGRSMKAGDFTAVHLLPEKGEVPVGRRIPFRAIGVLPYGNEVDLSEQGIFQTTTPDLVAFDKNATGMAIAQSQGLAKITFQFDTQHEVETLLTIGEKKLDQLVSPQTNYQFFIDKKGAGYQERRFRLDLSGVYSNGSLESLGDQVSWTVENEEVIALDSESKGAFFLKKPGQTKITATKDALTLSYQIEVGVGSTSLQSLSVDPAPTILPLFTERPIRITALYSDGTTADVTGSAVVAVSPSSLATILPPTGNQSLRLKSQALGDGHLTVAFDGVTQKFPVAAPESEVSALRIVSPRNFLLAKGQVESFTLWQDYSDGTTENITSKGTFTSSTSAVLNATGVKGQFKALKSGQANISASFGSLSATKTIVVSAATVVSLAITAESSSTLGLFQTRDFTATATYTDQTIRDVTQEATWSFIPDTGAGVFGGSALNHRFQGTGTGTGTIKATFSGVGAEQPLVIGSIVPVGLTLQASWESLSLAAGARSLTGTVTFSDGSSQDKTSDIEFDYDILGAGLNFAGYVRNDAGFKGSCVPLAVGFFKVKATYQSLATEKTIQVIP